MDIEHFQSPDEETRWFVMRDLKRANAKMPAYKYLAELGFDVFTPMHWVLRDGVGARKQRLYLPYIPSLLFVHSPKSALDKIVEKTDTLQYRFVKGAPPNTPMTVDPEAMDDFKKGVMHSKRCTYYSPDEITPDMIGKKVMVMGGNLDGTTGNLLKTKGSKKKKLILRIEGLLAAIIEIESDFIQFV